MFFTTYLLASRYNGTLYVGHTDDLFARVEQHRASAHGAGSFTSRHGVHHCVWFEEHETREAAFLRERRIKKWERAWKLRLVGEFNPLWLSITDCPQWPRPSPRNALLSDIRARCLAESLDPRLRGDERWEERLGVVDWPKGEL